MSWSINSLRGTFGDKVPRLTLGVMLLAATGILPSLDVKAADSSMSAKRIVFLGDSLTAGFGLDQEESYPALIQAKILAAGANHTVVNAGLSGDTTAGGLRRMDWLLREKIDILVIALGANDGLRGLPTAEVKKNLVEIIERLRRQNTGAEVLLAGMLVPPNIGPEYADRFRAVFPDVARETRAHLLPFLLDGVAGNPDMNQQDGIHPTAAGQQRIADIVWETLGPLLEDRPK